MKEFQRKFLPTDASRCSSRVTGMFKEAVIGILAAVAKQERVRLSDRTMAGYCVPRLRGGLAVVPRPRIQNQS